MAFIGLNSIGGFIGGLFGRGINKDSFGWRNNSSYLLGQKGPQCIDTSLPNQVYNEIYTYKTVVETIAKFLCNGVIKIVDKDGKDVEDPEFKAFIAKPNPLQTQNEWLYQYAIQLLTYGEQVVYKNQASTMMKYPSSMINISAFYVEKKLTGKVFDQLKVEDIISKFILRISGEQKEFDPKDIMFSKIPDLDSPINGLSPIKSLKYPLSNPKLADEYLNVISGEKGAIGILSNNGGKDQFGSVAMNPEEKKRIQDSYIGSNGVQDGQKRIIITETNVKWDPMSYPTQQLQLLEQKDSYFLSVCHALGVNPNVLPNFGSTYENQKSGELSTYINCVIPKADHLAQLLTSYLMVDRTPGNRIIIDFEHLAIFKEAKSLRQTAINAMIASYAVAVQNGFMTPETAKQLIDTELGIDSNKN